MASPYGRYLTYVIPFCIRKASAASTFGRYLGYFSLSCKERAGMASLPGRYLSYYVFRRDGRESYLAYFVFFEFVRFDFMVQSR